MKSNQSPIFWKSQMFIKIYTEVRQYVVCDIKSTCLLCGFYHRPQIRIEQ